jgi:hypothetical protein
LRIELAMTFKADFPDIVGLRPCRTQASEAAEAVSGCNIAILPLDASILPLPAHGSNDRARRGCKVDKTRLDLRPAFGHRDATNIGLQRWPR